MAYKKKTISYHKNRRMNDKTYKLRSEVMKIIYEAKKLLDGDMPRIDIRITDCDRKKVLATARMKDCIVWIPVSTIENRREYLREVVYHELCHAIWGIEHDDKCPLMSPVIGEWPLTKRQCEKIFKEYYLKKALDLTA